MARAHLTAGARTGLKRYVVGAVVRGFLVLRLKNTALSTFYCSTPLLPPRYSTAMLSSVILKGYELLAYTTTGALGTGFRYS